MKPYALVEIEWLSKRYPLQENCAPALEEVSLTIARGDYVSIEGPSGSGKTTLLAIIGGLERPSSGSYRFGGADVASMSDGALAKFRGSTIGFVFQSYPLLPKLSVVQNVELPLVYGNVDRQERRRRALEALGKVGLEELDARLPAQLSGGQQQRTAIARALCAGPELILADEPTGSLDRENSLEILRLFEDLNQTGLTIVVVTHDTRVAERTRRRIGLLDGRIDFDEEQT